MGTGAKVAIGALIAVVLLVPIAGLGLLVLALGGAGDDTPGPDGSCDAFDYVGQEPSDRCARPGEPIEVDGLSLTVSPLTSTTDRFDQEALCTDVRVRNTSDEAMGLFGLGWGLQRPDGQIDDAGIGIDFPASRLAAGASTSGTVCFDDVATRDEDVVVFYDPIVTGERAAWVGPVDG